MNGLERVRRASHFQKPDRVPHLLPDGGPNDIVWLWPPRPATGLATDWQEGGGGRWQCVDEWGNVFERLGPSGSGEVVKPAMPDWGRLDETLALLATPPPAEPLARYRAEIQQDNGAHYYLAVVQHPSLFAACHDLRGLVNLFVDFYEHRQEVERLLDRLAESQIACVDLLAGTGVHGVMGYDDWGLQDRPLISPALWRRLFAPRYRRVWQHAHSRGLDVWLHSCGYILPLLDMMIECGLNVVQMDQQENMGLENLARVAGGRLAFWCPVDIQATMARGSPEEIERYVRRMIYHLGRYDGGFISKHYAALQDVGHTAENLAVMCRAFRRWGVYPLAKELCQNANAQH